MAIILDGKATAKRLNEQTGERVQQLVANGTQPGIAVILVGDDPASEIYTRNKQRKAESLGMKSLLKKFPTEVTQDTLLNEINHLNADPSIHAILVQAPLPDHIDGTTVTNAIVPEKDVDGFNPVNLGKLYANQAGHYPVACTPKGIMTVLAQYNIDVAGKDVVVVGRSILVGRPVAALLVNANATVTLASRHTKDLNRLTKAADIVVVAIGNPNFIKGENLKAGAVVIDVGINRLDNGKLVGDVDFASAEGVVSAITPVPGGVGPMTIATLMQQTVELAEWSSSDGK